MAVLYLFYWLQTSQTFCWQVYMIAFKCAVPQIQESDLRRNTKIRKNKYTDKTYLILITLKQTLGCHNCLKKKWVQKGLNGILSVGWNCFSLQLNFRRAQTSMRKSNIHICLKLLLFYFLSWNKSIKNPFIMMTNRLFSLEC